MVRLIKNNNHRDYVIQLDGYDLTLILEGLTLLINLNNEAKKCIIYENNLLEDLREIKS